MAPEVISINPNTETKISPLWQPTNTASEANEEVYQRYRKQENSISTLRLKYKNAKAQLDRMKNEGSAQKKMILDISDIVKALHEISGEFDDAASLSSVATLEQVTRKIHAIDKQLKFSMLHSVQLEELKEIANSTILDQEKQIKTLENQVSLLSVRLEPSDKSGILLPDTSYEAQVVTMQNTIDDLEGQLRMHKESDKFLKKFNKTFESKRQTQFNTSRRNKQSIYLSEVEDAADSSYTTEDTTQLPSSREPTDSLQSSPRSCWSRSNYEMVDTSTGELMSQLEQTRSDYAKLKSEYTKLRMDEESNELHETGMKSLEKQLRRQSKQIEELMFELEQTRSKYDNLKREHSLATGAASKIANSCKTAKGRVAELEIENTKLKEEQEDNPESVATLQRQLNHMEKNVESTKAENQVLKAAQEESNAQIVELLEDIAESDRVKEDFEELERTIIVKVEELEEENKKLKDEKEVYTSKIVELSALAPKADQVQNTILVRSKRLQQEQEKGSKTKEVMNIKEATEMNLFQTTLARCEELENENERLQKKQVEAETTIVQLTEEIREGDQVKQDFEELEQTVIARVEELEIENQRLKKDFPQQEEKAKELLKENEKLKQQDGETTATVAKICEETEAMKLTVQELTEENDQLIADIELKSRTAISKHPWDEALKLNEGDQEDKEKLKLETAIPRDEKLEEALARVECFEAEIAELKKEQEEGASLMEAEKLAQLDRKNEEIERTKKQIDSLKAENKQLKIDQADSSSRDQLQQTILRVESLEAENNKLKADKEEAKSKTVASNKALATESEQLKQKYDEVVEAKIQLQRLEVENEKLVEASEDGQKLSKQHFHHLKQSTALVAQLETENQRLQKSQEELLTNRISIEESQKIKQEYKDLEQSLLRANKRFEELQLEHARTLLLLDEGDEATEAGQSTVDFQRNSEAHRKLQRLHQAVVMKLADLSEENADLKDDLDETRAKLSIQREDMSILQAMKEDYASLMEKYISTADTLQQMEATEAKRDMSSNLNQEFAELQSQLAVVRWENHELLQAKDNRNAVEAKITMLERNLVEAVNKIESAEQKSEDRLSNLKDVITAYKQLEKDSVETTKKMLRLQAMINGETSKPVDEATGKKKKKLKKKSEEKIELLTNQRNAAWEQMEDVEKELTVLKLNVIEATDSKLARENDLKIVLDHYENLQITYDKSLQKVEKLRRKYTKAVRKGDVIKAEKQWDDTLKSHKRADLSIDDDERIVEGDSWDDEMIEIVFVDDDGNTIEEEISIIEDVIEQSVEDNGEQDDPNAAVAHADELQVIWQKFGISKEGGSLSNSHPAEDESYFDKSVIHSSDSEIPFDEMSDNGKFASRKCYAEVLVDEDVRQELSTISGNYDEGELLSLQKAQAQISNLMAQHKEALFKLESTERDLLIVKREAADAEKQQESRESKLRATTAKLYKLEREHEELQVILSDLKTQVNKAKNEARAREFEVTDIRKQLSTSNSEYQKLQKKHGRLIENAEMNAFCKELLNTIDDHKSDLETDEKAS
jgi:chromosome segregation ATPase